MGKSKLINPDSEITAMAPFGPSGRI